MQKISIGNLKIQFDSMKNSLLLVILFGVFTSIVKKFTIQTRLYRLVKT